MLSKKSPKMKSNSKKNREKAKNAENRKISF